MQIPTILSREAQDLLQRLLIKSPKHRITLPQVKSHAFFREIDWEKLASKQIKPPIHLRMEDYDDDDNAYESNEM